MSSLCDERQNAMEFVSDLTLYIIVELRCLDVQANEFVKREADRVFS